MSLISDIAAGTGKLPLLHDLPVIPSSGVERHDVVRSLREDNWENEGGRLAAERPETASPAISTNDVEALEAEVRNMESILASDLANGRMGMRYNNYAHRSRVLRQQRARLDVLRASVQSQEQEG